MSDDAQLICTTCGAANPPGARFCKHCGIPFAAPAPAPAAPATTKSAQVAQAPTSERVAEAPAPTPDMPVRLYSASEPATPATPAAPEPISKVAIPSAPEVVTNAPTTPEPPTLKADAPTVPDFHLPPPDTTDYPTQPQPHGAGGYPIVSTPDGPPAALLAGMAGLATYSPQSTTAVPKGKRSRKPLIVAISVLVLLALLVAAGLGIYAFINAHAEADAANELPGNTFAFASVDLVALAKNHPQYSNGSILDNGVGGQNASLLFKQATGLDFKSDVLPWLGRDIAVGGFSTGTSISQEPGQPTPQVAVVVLIKSRDDGAARAALNKAAHYLASNNGQTLSTSTTSVDTSTYSGVTLDTLIGDSGPQVTMGVANGWAFIASTQAAAHQVVDRLNGSGDTLAKSADFVHATQSLAGDRFATTYLSLKGIEALSGANAGSVPFIATYPLVVGDMLWTSLGLRFQVTLPSTHSTNYGNLSGDTTSLAALVPSTAYAYDGYANAGGVLQAFSQLSGTQSDPAQSFFGIPSSDPALQHPAAVAVLPNLDTASGVPLGGGLVTAFFLQEPDATTAQGVLTEIEKSEGFTAKPMLFTVTTPTDGTVKTIGYALYASEPGSFLGTDYGYDYASTDPLMAGPSTPPYLVGYAAYEGQALVLTPSLASLQSIDATANGDPSSLANYPDFQKLLHQQPQGAAGTAYINTQAIINSGGLSALAPGMLTGASSTSPAPALQGILITQVLDANKLQFTVDEQIGK